MFEKHEEEYIKYKGKKLRVYDKIEDMFADGLFSPTEVVIIWGKRRKGKSSLAGKLMSEFMRPNIAKRDVQVSKQICSKLNEAGYSIRPPNDHTVFCDTYFETKGFMRQRNSAYKFNGIGFGLPNDIHTTTLLCPCGRYFLDETQDLFDSHLGALPTFITKAIELSGQYKLFLCFIAQRPKRLHIDIRDLAIFIEVVEIHNEYNKYNTLLATYWICNIINDNAILETYLSNRNPNLVDKTVVFKYRGNIFNCYDSDYFIPMFVRGKENEGLVLEKTTRTQYSADYFEKYFKSRVIDIPETFRGKKPKQSKEDKAKKEKSKKEEGENGNREEFS